MQARRFLLHVIGLSLPFLVHAPLALAAEPPKLNGADTAWMIVATVLVLFMTLPGLALFYAGLVRAKNVLSVLMHCVAVACLVSVLWFACGYSLAFVGTNPWSGDLSQAFLAGVGRGAVHPGTTIPDTVYIMFQMTFAIITPGLIIGAYVERI